MKVVSLTKTKKKTMREGLENVSLHDMRKTSCRHREEAFHAASHRRDQSNREFSFA